MTLALQGQISTILNMKSDHDTQALVQRVNGKGSPAGVAPWARGLDRSVLGNDLAEAILLVGVVEKNDVVGLE